MSPSPTSVPRATRGNARPHRSGYTLMNRWSPPSSDSTFFAIPGYFVSRAAQRAARSVCPRRSPSPHFPYPACLRAGSSAASPGRAHRSFALLTGSGGHAAELLVVDQLGGSSAPCRRPGNRRPSASSLPGKLASRASYSSSRPSSVPPSPAISFIASVAWIEPITPAVRRTRRPRRTTARCRRGGGDGKRHR